MARATDGALPLTFIMIAVASRHRAIDLLNGIGLLLWPPSRSGGGGGRAAGWCATPWGG